MALNLARRTWAQPPRPEWVERINAEGIAMGVDSLVPLEAEELISTASKTMGLSNFGTDEWREPLSRFVEALNDEAELNLMGRLMCRSDILRWLEARLGIEEAYSCHPEIENEVIDRPVIVVGLPRTGTSILYEILARNPDFGSPRFWELVFPYPPPEAATLRTDERIGRSHQLTTQWARVAPSWASIHEQGAEIPGECIYAIAMSFMAGALFGSMANIPSYMEWLAHQDLRPAYVHYKRTLKMLQWHNPRKHWLLKCPSHMDNLPVLFDVFPDAEVILTQRDPIASHGSLTNAVATHRYMRSDRPFPLSDIDEDPLFAGVIGSLNRVIDQLESGAIPAGQVHNSRYADLVSNPLPAIEKIFSSIGLGFSSEARERMAAYIASKPKGKFGKHVYDVGDAPEIARKRKLAARFQGYFNVPDEV
jgi:hypothetical protein